MSAPATTLDHVALVAIGRNEGVRLQRCLESVVNRMALVVYVDSGSTDGSPDFARKLGVRVVPLDLRLPFTAARARNAGFREALRCRPDLRHVQFVDGDCEVLPDWLEQADRFLADHPEVVAVTGTRRERFPERSLYNQLCDIEWNPPAAGEVRHFGGDVMIRADALQDAGGYRENLIAGEEPELAVRLRAKGWRIHHLGAPMTLHDAALTRFGQWWKRAERTGHAYAEGAALHGAPPERHWVAQSRSAWLWGLGLPVAIAVAALLCGPIALLALLVYPLQVLRLSLRLPTAPAFRRWHALFLVLGKFAEASGQLRFVWRHWSRSPARLIEYK